MTYQPAPGMDDNHHAPAPAVAKAPSVSLAEKLMYAGAGITVLNGLLSLFTDQDAVREQVREQLQASGQAFDDATVDAAMQLGMIGGLVSMVISAALWALMGWLNGKGIGWARIVATILGILGVLLTVIGLAGTAVLPGAAAGGILPLIISIILGVIALAVVVLLWRPDASEYFAARRRR